MTTLLLVLGAIVPLMFAAVFGIGALVGLVRSVAQLCGRLTWLQQQASPRAGVQIARFDARNAEEDNAPHGRPSAAGVDANPGMQSDAAAIASAKTLEAERRDTQRLRSLLDELQAWQPGHRTRQTVLAIRGFSIDDIDFGLWLQN